MLKEVIKRIVSNVLIAFYQPLLFAIVLSMFIYVYVFICPLSRRVAKKIGFQQLKYGENI